MSDEVKKKWGLDELETIYDSPFNDLIWNSHNIHRKYHDRNIEMNAYVCINDTINKSI